MHIYLWFLQYRETFVFTCCGAQGQGKEIIYWYIYICNTVKNSWATLDFFIFCWRNQGWFGAIAPQAVEKSFKDFLWTLAAFPIVCSPACVPEQCQMIYSVCLFDHKLQNLCLHTADNIESTDFKLSLCYVASCKNTWVVPISLAEFLLRKEKAKDSVLAGIK